MNKKRQVSVLTAVFASSLGIGATHSWAQETKTESLEIIVVTAEKRTANLQKTSIAITAMSGDELQARGEIKLNDALVNVPTLKIQSSPQGGSIYIRGVGSNGDSNEVDPAVGLTIDGTYSSRSEALAIGLYDVGQIEVLRGPQGTIYGRNATGGAVNITTANPNFEGISGKINSQLGNYSMRHIDGAVNLPVSDTLALRFAVMRETRDGYFSNGGQASDVTGFRGKLLFEPHTDLSLLITADYAHSEGGDQTTAPLPNGPWDSISGWDASDPWSVDDNHPADQADFTYKTLSAQLNWDMDWATLTIIPTYKNSQRVSVTSLVTGIDPRFGGTLDTQDWEEEQYTGEIRLVSPADSKLQWVAGAYYLWAENLPASGRELATNIVDVSVPNPDDPDNPIVYDLYNADESATGPTKSKAVFGQITYPLLDELRFILGVRYTEDEKEQSVQVTSIEVPGYDSGLLSLGADFSQTTFRLGFEYDLSDDVMSYATISSGYKAGGFFRGFPLRTYKPEELLSYELGIKGRFLDNRLQVNSAIYHYDYKNLQVQYSDPTAMYAIPESYLPEGIPNVMNESGKVANADTGTIYGAEIEVDWLLTPYDRLNLTLTVSDSEYGNFDPITSAELAATSGEEMANSPSATISLGYEHIWDLAEGELKARFQTHNSDGYWTDVRGRTRTGAFQDSYWRSDAYITYTAENWTAGLWLKNLENEAQVTRAFPLNRVFITNPRTIGVNVSFTF